jgi:hypothetical protein
MVQGELFEPEKIPIEYLWEVCWNWPGPEVGGYCQVNEITAKLADGTGSIYAYMLRCRILEQLPDGRYLVEVDNPEITWTAGRLILPKDNIWPPTRDLIKAAADEESEEV